MENASKALIIAGAILISIVLIAIGVMIVNSANNVVNQASDTMSDQDIQIFNAKFENYAGSRKGSQVVSLMNAIRSNNATAKQSGGQEVSIVAENENTAVITIKTTKDGVLDINTNAVKANATYTVEFSYDGNGCINQVKINDSTGKNAVKSGTTGNSET